MRQQWIDRHFARLLGIPTIQVTSWTTGHGDLHVGNLLPPPLVLIDWEGWGRMPTGFDIGLFHAYRLTAPATAARIRTTFPDILRTEVGRIGELVSLAQLLQVSERGGHPELTPHLAQRAEQLAGIPVPDAAGGRRVSIQQPGRPTSYPTPTHDGHTPVPSPNTPPFSAYSRIRTTSPCSPAGSSPSAPPLTRLRPW